MEIFFKILLNVISSFISAFGFSFLFNVQKKYIVVCAIISSIGWTIYYILSTFFISNNASNFIGAFIVGLLGELASRKFKQPSTVFICIGIIMLVPGYGMYHTMEYFANNDYYNALKVGVSTMITACSIAFGVMLASLFSKSINRVKIQRTDMSNSNS